MTWIDGTSFYKHALTSIDGHWLDDSSISNPPWLMKSKVTISQIKLKTSVVGKCNFLEKIERPDRRWVSNTDMEYGVGDRILASTEAVYINFN